MDRGSDPDRRLKRVRRAAVVIAIATGCAVSLGWLRGDEHAADPAPEVTFELPSPGVTVVLRVTAPVLY